MRQRELLKKKVYESGTASRFHDLGVKLQYESLYDTCKETSRVIVIAQRLILKLVAGKKHTISLQELKLFFAKTNDSDKIFYT